MTIQKKSLITHGQILVYQIKLLLFLWEIWYYFVEDNALKERDA